MLGANLVLDARQDGHQVIAVDYQHPVRCEGVESVTADLSRPGEASGVLAEHRPDWVIHCAAATSVDGCEADPALAFRLNRDMARQVAMAASAAGARLVHISTDAVFDGERGGYTEADQPHPINVYAESKLEGERVVLGEHPQALIVRTNIYGWNAQPKHSLAEWFLARLEAGQSCPGFADAWFSPILVNDLGVWLVGMLRMSLQGVYHVAGGECVSKYDFGVQVARVFGLDERLIRQASMAEAGLGARRGQRLCLDCSKAEAAFGQQLPDLQAGLQRFADLGRQGRAESLRSLCIEVGKDGAA